MFASQYISIVGENLGTLLDQIESIKKAAEKIAGVVSNGKNVFVFDSYGSIDNELVDRASGLALFRSLKNSMIPMSEGDILIISSYHHGNESDLRQVDDAHALGVSVIAITPPGQLAQSADMALLNNIDTQNGVITVSGISRPFCPVSGIINAVLAWTLTAETVLLLMADGKVPTVYCGEYLTGGKEMLNEARKRFSSLGY